MDVITLSVTSKPSGVGARFRVMRAEAEADGSVSMLLFSETNWPADGTSSAGARDPYGPLQLMKQSDDTGIACATGTNDVDECMVILPFTSGPAAFDTGNTYRLVVRAVRSGGAADTDLVFRLVDRDNADAVLATTPGVGTSAEFDATTTFANIPTTGDHRIVLQSVGANSATGTLYGVSWEGEENSPSLATYASPSIFMHWSDVSGVAVATGTNLHVSGSPYFMAPSTPNGYVMLFVYADGTSATGLTFGLRNHGHHAISDRARTGTITTLGVHSATVTTYAGLEWHLVSTMASGSATVYGFTIMVWPFAG
jgi:hypothetical protein